MSDNTPYRTAFVVTSDRVNHYNEVIEMMVANEINRCKTKDNFTPTNQQVAFYKKELVRHMTIGRNLDFAQKIKISKSNILHETPNRLSSRV
jgi:hypothetical protein